MRLGHPGREVEGKGPIWDAKWRGKDRLGAKIKGKLTIWEHGGRYGACALDTPRQAEPAARRVKLLYLTVPVRS